MHALLLLLAKVPWVVNGYSEGARAIIELRGGTLSKVISRELPLGGAELAAIRISPDSRSILLTMVIPGQHFRLTLLRTPDLKPMDTGMAPLGYTPRWASNDRIEVPVSDTLGPGWTIAIADQKLGKARKARLSANTFDSRRAQQCAEVLNTMGLTQVGGRVAPEFSGHGFSEWLGPRLLSADYSTMIVFAEKRNDGGHTRIVRNVAGRWTVKSLEDATEQPLYVLSQSSFGVVRSLRLPQLFGGEEELPMASIYSFSGAMIFGGLRATVLDVRG